MFEKKRNLDRMEELLHMALKAHPDTQLVVYPELATSGYQCHKEFIHMAEIADEKSPSISKMAKLARQYGIHIVFGMPEKDSDDEKILYNSQILIDDSGKLIGSYRKVHLFDSEKQWFTPGKVLKVFDTKIGRLGLFICYDAFFPEVARVLAVKGVDLLINSTNWEKPYDYDMDMIMAARALENTVYLACCNRIGVDTTLDFFGHTRILDPLGKVISEVEGEIEDYVYARLDYDSAQKMKNDYYTMLTERRPELYQDLMI
jgi:predicted amidohydrolase